jgi:hypothetical protein
MSYSEEFAKAGTLHKRLIELVKVGKRDACCGSVFRSFANALELYMQYYAEQVLFKLEAKNDLTLVTLYSFFKPLMDQIRCV